MVIYKSLKQLTTHKSINLSVCFKKYRKNRSRLIFINILTNHYFIYFLFTRFAFTQK